MDQQIRKRPVITMKACCLENGCQSVSKARGLCNLHYLRRWKAGGTEALPVIKTPTLADRFWAKVDKSGECWVWTAAHNGRRGYGGVQADGRWKRASRVSWEMENGPIPDGLHVLHRCDNPPCVRPDHLFLGTQSDNNHDRDRKGRGRWSPGEANGCHKLTNADILDIRRLSSSGVSRAAIASMFNINKNTVSGISTRRTWKHVNPSDASPQSIAQGEERL